MNDDRTILEPCAAPVARPSDLTILESPPGARPATSREAGQRAGLPGPRTARGVCSDTQSMPALIAGAHFRDYRLEAPIEAASAEADLWILSHRLSGDRAVLKYYRFGIRPKPEILEAVLKLKHDSVVRVFESGESGGRNFEIQEFIEHGSLADVFGGRPASDSQLRAILKELADALADVHAAGIIHRDLKPANILVRRPSPLDLVLGDFGISSLSDLSLHLSSVNRTASYAAPEAMTGVVARTSDWWSVGVILLELLTGKHPFAGVDERTINLTLVSCGIELPASLPADWDLLLRGLLTRDYAKRWGLEQVRAWMDGRRDLAVHYAGNGGVADQPARKPAPYKFGGKEHHQFETLARAFASDWDEAVKHVARGYVLRWVEDEIADVQLANLLQDINEDDRLAGDLRLSAVLLALDPTLPLVWRSQVIDQAWLMAHTTVPAPLNSSHCAAHPDDVPLLKVAQDAIRKERAATPAVLERHFDVSTGRAQRMLDTLERRGLIGPSRERRSREIYFDIDGGARDLPSDAGTILQSSLPDWLRRLRGQEWLLQLAEKRRQAWDYFRSKGLLMNPGLGDQVLLTPHEDAVWSLVEERRREFCRSHDATLDELLNRTGPLQFNEAVALVAADTGTLVSQERELLNSCLNWLTRLNFRYDRALATKLILARDWDLVNELWSSRHEEFGGAVPSVLQAIYEMEDPEYLDAVALAAAEPGLFVGHATKRRQNALEWLDRLHIHYDREMAAELAEANDRNAVLKLCHGRRNAYSRATPKSLDSFLHSVNPRFLEAVALVTAHRAHFQTAAQEQFAADMTESFGPGGKVAGWGASQKGAKVKLDYGQVQIPTICGSGIVAIAAGGYHSVALRFDGQVVAWGSNDHRQCAVPELGDVVAIAAGGRHTLVLQADGSIIAWGHDGFNQSNVPKGLSPASAISAGGKHSLALLADGTVVAWGDNQYRQCEVPADLKNVAMIAAGGRHSLALTASGSVVGWGDSEFGQCSVPWHRGTIVRIAAGKCHSLALDDLDRVLAWGAGGKKQTENPHFGQSAVPAGMSGITAISAGARHSLAVCNGGRVIAWGDGHAGQTLIQFEKGESIGIAAGGCHSLALMLKGEPDPLPADVPDGKE